jgi:hypothetical protein
LRIGLRHQIPRGHMLRRLLTRENLYAFLLCLILIAVAIVTADKSPQWIYQGF